MRALRALFAATLAMGCGAATTNRTRAPCSWSAWTALIGLTLSGCGVPMWPVPVPPLHGHDESVQRAEAALPLCGGAETCAERAAIDALLRAHQRRCRRPRVPDALSALLEALRKPALLGRSEAFPDVAGMPADVRSAERVEARDARGDVEQDSVAFLVNGVWWTFWDQAALSEDPEASARFTHLIVFPDYEGRDSCKDW